MARGRGLAYSFVVSLIMGFVVEKTIGLRVTEEDEVTGVDQTEHAETAYDWRGLSGSLHRAAVERGRRYRTAASRCRRRVRRREGGSLT